ncbi:MAG: aminodeoxychorismate synthase, subunit [Bryobacterales bacterium]|nr:aminodeoxychorismate synthase, subunit [Bryobacterales bacterium]
MFWSVLPPAPATQPAEQVHVQSTASPDQVADLLQNATGFIWLDGASGRHLLFHEPLAVLSCDGAEISVHGPGGHRAVHGKSLDGLDAALQAWSAPGALFAGWIGYEVGEELERFKGPSRDVGLPRLHFGLYDSVLIWTAEQGWSQQGTCAWRPFKAEGQKLLDSAQSRPLAEPPPRPSPPVENDDEGFLNGVKTIVRAIYAGDLFQTNLCRHLVNPFAAGEAWPLYRRMRQLNPAAAGAFVCLDDDRQILSGSPESFLRVRSGAVESQPIKGTRARGQTPAADVALRNDLAASEKDRAELAMVVDVTRNDLSRVCLPGTVHVAEHAKLLTLPTLHHTYSRVTGQLCPGTTPADLLRAAFPPASITGAPKIAAMSAAWREELAPRGPCMGSIGWISSGGDMELSVAIRTAFTTPGQITYLAGCGITADSDPASELAESQAKAAAFLRALGLANNERGPVIAAEFADGADPLQSQTEF